MVDVESRVGTNMDSNLRWRRFVMNDVRGAHVLGELLEAKGAKSREYRSRIMECYNCEQ